MRPRRAERIQLMPIEREVGPCIQWTLDEEYPYLEAFISFIACRVGTALLSVTLTCGFVWCAEDPIDLAPR